MLDKRSYTCYHHHRTYLYIHVMLFHHLHDSYMLILLAWDYPAALINNAKAPHYLANGGLLFSILFERFLLIML